MWRGLSSLFRYLPCPPHPLPPWLGGEACPHCLGAYPVLLILFLLDSAARPSSLFRCLPCPPHPLPPWLGGEACPRCLGAVQPPRPPAVKEIHGSIYWGEGVLETKKILVRTETNRSKICFGCVSVCFVKPKTKNFGLFRSNLYRNNRNKQNCFETNQNNPKFSEKYQNMLSIKLFRLGFCLCFGSSVFQNRSKTTDQNKPKQP